MENVWRATLRMRSRMDCSVWVPLFFGIGLMRTDHREPVSIWSLSIWRDQASFVMPQAKLLRYCSYGQWSRNLTPVPNTLKYRVDQARLQKLV